MSARVRALAAALAVAFLVSCAPSRSASSRAVPCEDCTEGVTYVKKAPEKHAFCLVNGRQVDCTKNPPECPKCAQGVRRSVPPPP